MSGGYHVGQRCPRVPWNSPLYHLHLASRAEESPPGIFQDRRKRLQEFLSTVSY